MSERNSSPLKERVLGPPAPSHLMTYDREAAANGDRAQKEALAPTRGQGDLCTLRARQR